MAGDQDTKNQVVAERSYDLRTSGLWAQYASTEGSPEESETEELPWQHKERVRTPKESSKAHSFFFSVFLLCSFALLSSHGAKSTSCLV